MEITEELDVIIEEVRNAKPVPFSASVMINKESLLERLENVRRNVPEELDQARYVMRDRDDMVARIQQEAEQLVAEARAERERMASETEIVEEANRQAARLLQGAKVKAEELKAGAEDYVDSRLANFEVVLQKTLAVVTRGRDSLKGRLDAGGQRVPQDEPGALADFDPDSTGNVRLRP